MENHSFDNIAGYWDFNPAINGLKDITFCNNYTNPNWTVWNEPISICAGPYDQEVPLKDPDHNFAGTSFEIYQNWNPTNADTPTMGGFVDRQSADYNATPGDSAFVIKTLDQTKTQILATIAQNFAFWDSYVRWDSPNLLILHSLTKSSMLSTLAPQTLIGNLPHQVRHAAMLITLINPLVSS